MPNGTITPLPIDPSWQAELAAFEEDENADGY
jgi:hypothetical protein